MMSVKIGTKRDYRVLVILGDKNRRTMNGFSNFIRNI